MKLSKNKINLFQNFIWDFYQKSGRFFVWRNVADPYKIVVSEIMLQQTQTYRVEQKYEQFVAELSTFEHLADAPLRTVLSLWQGLGYNRRALYLQQIAKKVINEYDGQVPNNLAILETFPGIGKATAASICAFAFNRPTVFIETNIRTVFIHSFFSQQASIADKSILPLIEQTLDKLKPREWYYALMDYGVLLKKSYPHIAKKSAHYSKQSKFEGSNRQIRGLIIKILTEKGKASWGTLASIIKSKQDQIGNILQQLCDEGLIKKNSSEEFCIK